MTRLRLAALLSIAAVCLSSAGCACPKVQLPSSDSTPPNLEWRVTNQDTNAVQNFTTNGSFTAHWGQRYEVKLTATDDGGVHEASLVGSIGWSCTSGNVGQSIGPGLEAPDVEKHDVWPSGEVCSEIVQYRDLDFHFTCQSGFEFAGGSAVLTGTGKNFHGGVTTGTLSITVAK